MTSHARTTIADEGIVGLISIRHNFKWSGVESPSLSVRQKIPLQPVWKIKNDLSARRIEPKRISEDILVAQVAAEIVTAPVRAERRDMPFQRPVVLRNAARTHPCANHVLFLRQMAHGFHSQSPFEFGDIVRQPEQFVIKRRSGS